MLSIVSKNHLQGFLVFCMHNLCVYAIEKMLQNALAGFLFLAFVGNGGKILNDYRERI